MTPLHSPKLVLGAADWLVAMAILAAFMLLLLAFGYWRAGASRGVRMLAATLKALGILLLAFCLLEPLFSGERARPGANQFVILADNSQSMMLKDGGETTRGKQLQTLATQSAAWFQQLGRDFDLHLFSFDTQLHSLDNFDALSFDGRATDLGAALDRLTRRYQSRPLAGVLLMTDGNATDADAVEGLLARATAAGNPLPPIYPVMMGRQNDAGDVSLEHIDVTQTNFEDTPVTVTANLVTSGERGRTIVAELLDEAGKSIERQKVQVEKDGAPLAVRFRLRPEEAGISFYRVRVGVEENGVAQFEAPDKTTAASANAGGEATYANNSRLAVVDRGKGPFRVLYVVGRPNWEYKFLQRAVSSDEQVQLVGLVRVAPREPKFNFMGRADDTANPLFRGFLEKDREQIEQYDQPVFVRYGTADETELKGGFPKSADDLFKYHAIIIDDVEADFFSQDQMQLLKDFVRQRGGGLLMLGGQESFKNGKFDRTLLGDVLPVYADQIPDAPPDATYRFDLTREGWLEPWLRLRPEEAAERTRLSEMPQFSTVNQIRGIKPGATVLARAIAPNGDAVPALVEQRFGKGRSAALLLADLWQWGMQRPIPADDDMEKAWRQTIRWLVSDVQQRVDVSVDPHHDLDDAEGSLTLAAQVRDPMYAPLDNATVTIRVTGPDGKPVELHAQPSPQQPGRYEALYVPRQPGAYRAQVVATAPDGSDVGTVQAGWASDPAAEEFRQLQPDVAALARIAQSTGGQVVNAADVAAFAATLPTRHAQITEPYVVPFWHQSWVFLLAIILLAAEWGLRRWKGLP